jgi:drug/metabolite transporter (DMT)-like permease
MLVPASIATLGALFAAFAMLMLRQVGPSETPEAIATHFSLTAAASLGTLALVYHPPHVSAPSARDVGVMLATGVCAGLAQLAMTRAYSLELAARVSPFGYLAVVASTLLGAALLGETPDPLAIGGMMLVIAAGVIVMLAGLRDERRLVRAVSATLSSGTLGEGASPE